MPKLPKRPRELTGKIFRGEYALRRGLLTRAELRSSAWQPVFRGVHADRTAVVTHRLKCVAASTYLLPDGAAIAGRSAAWIYGASSGRDSNPVEVISTQQVISHNGHFVARVDLAWPELKIALEYDGYWHADRGQLERDRARLNRLLGADWLVLHVTAQRMRDDFDGLIREIRVAMRSRQRAAREWRRS